MIGRFVALTIALAVAQYSTVYNATASDRSQGVIVIDNTPCSDPSLTEPYILPEGTLVSIFVYHTEESSQLIGIGEDGGTSCWVDIDTVEHYSMTENPEVPLPPMPPGATPGSEGQIAQSNELSDEAPNVIIGEEPMIPEVTNDAAEPTEAYTEIAPEALVASTETRHVSVLPNTGVGMPKEVIGAPLLALIAGVVCYLVVAIFSIAARLMDEQLREDTRVALMRCWRRVATRLNFSAERR
jgi:hypothetical protein